MLRALLLLVVGAGLALPAAADEPMLGPAIEGYGPTYPIADRDVALQDGAVYRAVFDVLSYSDDVSETSSRLVSVARFMNMHARNGTPVENMNLAVVIHGAAVKTVMNHAAYRERYGIDNPNLELVEKLSAAGVALYICGQSLAFGGVDKSELAGPVQVGLSAMTMLTVLQNDGYALLPD
jgi:intracellular sulfur oxidation DsrE/DsrF family protein